MFQFQNFGMEVGEINTKISSTAEKIKRQVLSLESVSQPNPYQNEVSKSVLEAFENLDLSSRESALIELGNWAQGRINTYNEYDDEFLKRIGNIQRMIDGKTVEQFQEISAQMDRWDEILQMATSNLERFHMNFDRFWARMPRGTDDDNGPFAASSSKLEKDASTAEDFQKQNKSVETLLKEFEEERQIYKAREEHYFIIIKSMQSFVNNANDKISALQKQQEDTSDELARLIEEHKTFAKEKEAQQQVIQAFLQKEEEAKQRLENRQVVQQDNLYFDLSGSNVHDNKLVVLPCSAVTIMNGNANISLPNEAGDEFTSEQQMTSQESKNETNSTVICDFPPSSNTFIPQSQENVQDIQNSAGTSVNDTNNTISASNNNNNNTNDNNKNNNSNNNNNQAAANKKGEKHEYVAVMGNNLPDKTADQAKRLLDEGNAFLAANNSNQFQNGQGQMQNGQGQMQNGQGQIQNGQMIQGQNQNQRGQGKMQNNQDQIQRGGQGQMQNGQNQFQNGQDQSQNGQGQFQNGQEQMQGGQNQNRPISNQQQFQGGQGEFQGQFQNGQNQLQNGQNQMQNSQNQFQNGQNGSQGQQGQMQNGQDQFQGQQGQMQNGQNGFQDQQNQIQNGQNQFQNGQGQYQNNQGSIQNGQQQFQNGQNGFQNGQQQFQNGQNGYQSDQQQFQNGYQNGQQQFQNGQGGYQNGQQQFQNGQGGFQDGQQQFQNGQGGYQNGQQQFQNGQNGFQDQQNQMQNGQNQFQNGQGQYQNNQGSIQIGQQQLQNGQGGYQDGQQQFQNGQGGYQGQQGQMQNGQGQDFNQVNGIYQDGDTFYDQNGQPITDPEQIQLYQQQQQQRFIKQQQQQQLQAFEQSMNQMQLDGLLTSDQQRVLLEQMQNYILQNGPLTPEQQQQFLQQMLAKMLENGELTEEQQQQVMQQIQQALQNQPTFGSNTFIPGMNNMNNMNGMNGMNNMNNMNGMNNMNSMNGMNGMNNMNGMSGMNNINGMNNMNGNVNGMNGNIENGANDSEPQIVLNIPSVNGQPLVRTLSGEFLSPNGNPLKHSPVFSVFNENSNQQGKLLVPIYQAIPALVIHHYQAEYMTAANKSSTPKSRSLSKKESSGKQDENENPNNEKENDPIIAMSGKQILVRTNPVTFPSAAYTCYDEYGRPIPISGVPTLFSQINRSNRVIIQPRPLRFKRSQPIRPPIIEDIEPLKPPSEPPQQPQQNKTENLNETKFDVTQPSQIHLETPRSKMQKSLLSTLPPKTNSAINDNLDEEKEAYHARLDRVMNDKGPENVTYSPRKMLSARGPFSTSSRRSTRESSTKMVPGEVQNNGIGLIITPFVHQTRKPAPRVSTQSLKPLSS